MLGLTVGWLRGLFGGAGMPAPEPVRRAATQPAPRPGKVVFPGTDGGPFEPLRALVETYDGPAPPQTLFFGDSVYLRSADEDADPRPMSSMLEDAVSGSGGGIVIAHSAFNLRLYEAMHSVLDTTKSRPRRLVVPINMRSFSPQWFDNPAWQFTEHLQLIAARTADRTAPLGPVDDLRMIDGFYDAYAAKPVAYELSSFTTIGAFRDVIAEKLVDEAAQQARLRAIMVFHYTHVLDAGHPLLSCLDSLVRHAQAVGTTVLPVLLPLNMGLGEQVAGPAFRRIVHANRQCVVERCAALGTPALDLVDMLPSHNFFHIGSPTEHLRDHGRCALTARIRDALGD